MDPHENVFILFVVGTSNPPLTLPVWVNSALPGIIWPTAAEPRIGLPDSLSEADVRRGLQKSTCDIMSMLGHSSFFEGVAAVVDFTASHKEQVIALAQREDFYPDKVAMVASSLSGTAPAVAPDFRIASRGKCVLDASGTLLAFAFFNVVASYSAAVLPIDPDRPAAYISYLCTSEQARGKGIGYQLMRQLFTELSDEYRGCDVMFVLDAANNGATTRFWMQHCGFSVVDRDSLPDPEEAELVELALDVHPTVRLPAASPMSPASVSDTSAAAASSASSTSSSGTASSGAGAASASSGGASSSTAAAASSPATSSSAVQSTTSRANVLRAFAR